MSGLQAYTPDRNRYFAGKLMTARDFELEQRYGSGRRRLLNRLLHGAGVAAGLGVLALDGQTFSLEAGVALDALGREIVVTEPCARRLSSVEGFQACGDAAWLCLRYAETPREETFSAACADVGGLEREYNCVREGYELYVTPEPPEPAGLWALWRQTVTLYQGEGLRLSLTLPRYAAPGSAVTGNLRLEKRGRPAPAHYRLTLSGDLFTTAEVGFDETEVGSDCEDRREVVLRCTATAPGPAALRVGGLSLACGAVDETPEDCTAELEVTSGPVAEAVADAYYRRDLSAGEDGAICLARLRLASDGTGYFIQGVDCDPLGQRLAGTGLLQLLRDLPDGAGTPERGAEAPVAEAAGPSPSPGLRMATGVEAVSLGYGAKAGRDYVSDEIVHGLGYGSVAVVAALENEAVPLSGEEDLLFFGEPGIFRGEQFPHTLPKVRMGAMASPGRGTLRLGVHLMEKTDRQSLPVRWWAFRAGGEAAPPPAGAGRVTVRVSPNTVTVEPLGQVRFTAMVEGDADQSVYWSVPDPEGGSVDQNGVYLAPGGEGVFEVVARSAGREDQCGSAYVVVHQAEEPEN